MSKTLWSVASFINLKLLVIATTVLLAGCELEEIPEVDETPPGFIFRVSGFGVSDQVDQDTDFGNIELFLLASETYTFSYLATDQGGVEYQEFRVGPYDRFEFDDLSPALVINETSGLTRSLWQLGDTSDPRTALSIGGKIRTIADTTSIYTGADFRFTVSDFGGASAAFNTTNALLSVRIVTDDDQLGFINIPTR